MILSRLQIREKQFITNRLRCTRFDLPLAVFAIITHLARHTFATTVALANKVTMKNVAKMLGHSSTRMTQHYVKVLDQSIMEDMINVYSKISIQKPSFDGNYSYYKLVTLCQILFSCKFTVNIDIEWLIKIKLLAE